jgi:hypothetical protein
MAIDLAGTQGDRNRYRLHRYSSDEFIQKTLSILGPRRAVGASHAMSKFDNRDDGDDDFVISGFTRDRFEKVDERSGPSVRRRQRPSNRALVSRRRLQGISVSGDSSFHILGEARVNDRLRVGRK